MKKKLRRGMNAIDPVTQKEIARMGGLALSQNRAHMAEIGRKGGIASGIKRNEAKLEKREITLPIHTDENT